MDPVRTAGYGTLAVIIAISLASGPLIGAVDLTREPSLSGLGTGSLTVTTASVPDTATLTRESPDAAVYRLDVPDATVTIATATGRPVLAYRVRIAGLAYTRTTVHFPSAGATGRTRVAFADDSFLSDRVGAARYDGSVRLVLRTNDTERTLANGSLDVEVRP
jgi:hypothetical protein